MANQVAHSFNPSPLEAEAGDLWEFEASLVYRVTSQGYTEKLCLGKKKKKECKTIGFSCPRTMSAAEGVEGSGSGKC